MASAPTGADRRSRALTVTRRAPAASNCSASVVHPDIRNSGKFAEASSCGLWRDHADHRTAKPSSVWQRARRNGPIAPSVSAAGDKGWPRQVGSSREYVVPGSGGGRRMIRIGLLALVPLAPLLHYVGLPPLWVFVAGIVGVGVLADWIRAATEQLAQPYRPGGRRPADGQPGQPRRADPGPVRAGTRRGGGGARPDHRLDHRHQPARPRPGDRRRRRRARAADLQARACRPAVQPADPGGDRAAAARGVRLRGAPRRGIRPGRRR